ncbi:MAG: hypothetical protein COB96_02115 [Planctomycetota bacterium]|jgi:hypothetical protein|nr:MAG: hypothetical protein COB96_02115 [Planctomycetota bacterium]
MMTAMKHILLSASVVAGVLSSAPLMAQDDLVAKYQAKISEPWVAHGGWSENLDDVLRRAKEEDKIVFAYFTRSYAP